jgi:dihydroflavonol-4-reductase
LILITGATGFLGYNLCEHLTKQGYALRALVRPSSDTSALETLQLNIVRGDITNEAAVGAAMEGCEVVIHAAAHFRFWGEPGPFFKTNVDGTACMVRAALAAKIKKFIHISTIIVVGPQKPGVVITEKTPCRPHSTDFYAQTKFLGESLIQQYCRKGLPAVILRLGALYGPYGHYAFNRLFFEEFLRNWRAQVHQGQHIIFPCYVESAAKGIEAALKRGQIGETYNICDESITHWEANRIVSQLAGRSSWRINVPAWVILSLVQILEAISRFTRREPYYPQNLKPYVFNDWTVDSSKAKQALEFRQIPFTEGAQHTLEWYRSIGYL